MAVFSRRNEVRHYQPRTLPQWLEQLIVLDVEATPVVHDIPDENPDQAQEVSGATGSVSGLYRHKVEQHVRENAEWLSATFDSLSDAVFACDLDGRVLMVNDVVEDLTGRPLEEFVRQHLGAVLEIRHASHGTGIGGLVKLALSGRKKVTSGNVEYVLVPEHGTRIPVEFSISPIIDSSDKLVGSVISIRDVRTANSFQEVLKRAKKEWERSMDSISFLVALVDKQRRIMRLNQAMARTLGVLPREAIGMSLSELFPKDELPDGVCPHDRCMADNKEHSALFFSSKVKATVVMTAAPYYDLDGQLIGSVHVVQRVGHPEELGHFSPSIPIDSSCHHNVAEIDTDRTAGELSQFRVELARCSQKLATTNEALRILVKALENKQRDLAKQAVTDLTVSLKPMLAELRTRELPQNTRRLVDTLQQIVSRPSPLMGPRFSKISHVLTPREIQICELIQSGTTTKQIAEIFGTTTHAVNKHRTQIRKKLGLNCSGQSLARYLQNTWDTHLSDESITTELLTYWMKAMKRSDPR